MSSQVRFLKAKRKELYQEMIAIFLPFPLQRIPQPGIRINIGSRWWPIIFRRLRRSFRAKTSATRYCRRVFNSRRLREHPRYLTPLWRGNEAGVLAAITPCYLRHRSSRGSDREKGLERWVDVIL